jgi:hypothetical protein
VNDVGGDHQILVDEVGRIAVVGMDAADPPGRQEDGVRPRRRHPGLGLRLPRQVDLLARDREDFAAFAGEAAHDGAADHAAMAGDPHALAGD